MTLNVKAPSSPFLSWNISQHSWNYCLLKKKTARSLPVLLRRRQDNDAVVPSPVSGTSPAPTVWWVPHIIEALILGSHSTPLCCKVHRQGCHQAWRHPFVGPALVPSMGAMTLQSRSSCGWTQLFAPTEIKALVPLLSSLGVQRYITRDKKPYYQL